MTASPAVFGCWTPGDGATAPPRFFDARGGKPSSCEGLSVIVDEAAGDAAAELLARGASMAFVAGAPARMGECVPRLAAQVGAPRVGVLVEAAPMEVRWCLECESNADFKTMAPSMPESCWEVMAPEGIRTGIRVDHWLRTIFAKGATAALVQADLSEARDSDLNVCAGLVEEFGARLWLAPSGSAPCDLQPWMQLGRARRFVLAPEWQRALLAQRALEASRAA